MVVRRALLIFASLLMTFAAWTAVSPSPASAAFDNSVCTPNCAGAAHWYSNGDTMQVCDYTADGYSVVAIADINGWDNYQYKWHTAGAGGCTDRSFGNLAEGKILWFKVCLGDYSDYIYFVDTCSSWVWGEA